MKGGQLAKFKRPRCSPVTRSFDAPQFLGKEMADVPNCTGNDV
jgi:hypothetical protein